MTTPVLRAGSLVGSPVLRVEDPALLRGEARFLDDLAIEGLHHAVFVRSPVAHAAFTVVDIVAAAAMAGVVAVLTAADLELPTFGGNASFEVNATMRRPPLAVEKVMFVGDPVVVVVARSRTEAVDAAEMVHVDYQPLPPIVDMEAALAEDAPVLHADNGDNLVVGGRAPEGLDPLAGADVVIRGRYENQRLAVTPIEVGGIAAVPGDDGTDHDITVYITCQMPHFMRGLLADSVGLDPARIRLVVPHVGGSFGGKNLTVEDIVVTKVALTLGLPIKWVETRTESMNGMHGRGQVQYVEMGFRRDGTIVGAHMRVIGDAGAYAGLGGVLAHVQTRIMAQGVYRIPTIAYDCAIAATTTASMGPYRGAGRPEATALLERTMDIAANELGIDPVELRRRNLIARSEFPFTTVTGQVYDSGDYERTLDEALRLVGYEELRAEQARRRARGDCLQLGIGVAMYVEVTGQGGVDYAQVKIDGDGTATILSGASADGQGHATTFSSIAADLLGLPLERIRFVQSDTAVVPRGMGTGGSRSLQIGGSAVHSAVELVLEQARALAVELLEAAPEDVVMIPGVGFGPAGVPARALSWAVLAEAAETRGSALAGELDYDMGASTFPFGTHVSVVEVDTETGQVVPVRHVAVDDCGRVVNPLIVDGQIHGGTAAGVAQALWEHFVYDADGNPLTSTLAEYGIPSAAELPSFETTTTETLTPLNPLGAKGVGEAGSIGATPAVQNAVVDALSHLGVRHLDMPCSPQRVRQAIRDAADGELPPVWREPPDIFARLPVLGASVAETEASAF